MNNIRKKQNKILQKLDEIRSIDILTEAFNNLSDLLSIIDFKYQISNSKNNKTLFIKKLKKIQEEMSRIIEINKEYGELLQEGVNPTSLRKALMGEQKRIAQLTNKSQGLMTNNRNTYNKYRAQQRQRKLIMNNQIGLRHFNEEYGILFEIMSITLDALISTTNQKTIDTFNKVNNMMFKIWSLNTQYSQSLKYVTNNSTPKEQFNKHYRELSEDNKKNYNKFKKF